MKTRHCLTCGSLAEHVRPSDGDYHLIRCAEHCGRSESWGHTEDAAVDGWNMANEPIADAQARARREARERIGRKGDGR